MGCQLTLVVGSSSAPSGGRQSRMSHSSARVQGESRGDARHWTLAIEGARGTDATLADQDVYVRGEIDIAELGDRMRSRYNLS